MAVLAPLAPYLMAGSTAVSGLAQMQNSNYQAAVATQNADLLRQQTERETFAANQDIADQDVAARGEIADLVAQMGSSGINANTGSLMFRRAGAEFLVARDRERLGQKRDIALENGKRQEASQRAEAKALKRSGRLALLGTAINAGSSFLSGATMLNDYNRGRMALTAPNYGR
jgi:hypothetical protein